MEQLIQAQTLHAADRYFAMPSASEGSEWTLAALLNFCKVFEFLTDKDIPPRTRFTLIARSSRVFLAYRAHTELCKLDTFKTYVAPDVGPDLFHHLNRRYYLAKNLRLRQRIEFLLTHYGFEEASFIPAYRRQVYRDGGLLLWSRNVRGTEFQIKLCRADRHAAEGDLSVCLMVDDERLHCISFSWANAEFARTRKTIVPFITANQGRWREDEHVQAKFNAAFPQNAANFACYAAMQGIAQAIGASEMLAVSSRLQVCFTPRDEKHFGNAYDIFWNAVGGVELPACGFALPVPRPVKPIDEIAAKHRRRTAAKRNFWADITDSTNAAVSALFRAH
jgi:uncharacterized protein VirK/YbjX